MTDLSIDKQISLETRNLSISYGDKQVVKQVNLKISNHQVTAVIGPSGCGKSTLLRTMNRMNDLVPSFSMEGEIIFQGRNIYGSYSDPGTIRQKDRDGVPAAQPFSQIDL